MMHEISSEEGAWCVYLIVHDSDSAVHVVLSQCIVALGLRSYVLRTAAWRVCYYVFYLAACHPSPFHQVVIKMLMIEI